MIPEVDCTSKNFFSKEKNISCLTQREKFQWCLQTESRIRMDRFQNRNARNSKSKNDRLDLSSHYLMNLYQHHQKTDGTIPTDEFKRDLWAYTRKPAYSLDIEDLDDSFDDLQHIQCDGYERHKHHLTSASKDGESILYKAIPPNQLYFELVLEAYIGYKLFVDEKDPNLPRPAIMGGSIVATLTSFRDAKVVQIFEKYGKKLDKYLSEKKQSEYFKLKKKIIDELVHCLEAFQDGDVDIFLQSSPHTRRLMEKLEHSLEYNSDVLQHIFSFIGGNNRDLQSYTEKLVGMLEKGIDNCRYENTWGFAFAVAHNTCTFTLGEKLMEKYVSKIYEIEEEDLPERWPRVTQCIILDNRADLFDALFDFDISCCACAFDGTNVILTPRALLSLELLTCMITPFCLQEKRNKKRVTKYFKRGFQPYLIDPYCTHPKACHISGLEISKPPSMERFTDDTQSTKIWQSQNLRTQSQIEKYDFDNLLNDDNDWRDNRVYCCCNYGTKICEADDGYARDGLKTRKYYTIAMFEKKKGDGISFFSKRWQWSKQDIQKVGEIDEKYRVACFSCRQDYAIQLVFQQLPKEIRDIEESIESDFAFSNSGTKTLTRFGSRHTFHPSFYFGGVFDSTKKMELAHPLLKLINLLKGQTRAEIARYILKNGRSPVGFKYRFTYGGTIDEAFSWASRLIFPKPSRPPIGLNPERIVGTCAKDGCVNFLHGCEYSTKYCTNCNATRKTRARLV